MNSVNMPNIAIKQEIIEKKIYLIRGAKCDAG